MNIIHGAWSIRYEGDNYFFLPHLPPTSIFPLYFYLPSSRVTFHCLSFVPLTVIHLPGRVHWISWSVTKISWLLFIHFGRIYPDEKTAPLYKFVAGKVFRCGTVHLDPSFNGIDTAWTNRYCGPTVITFGTALIIVISKLVSKYQNPPLFQASAAM